MGGWVIGPRGERFYERLTLAERQRRTLGQKGGITIDARGCMNYMERAMVVNAGPKIRKLIREEMRPVKKNVQQATKTAVTNDPGKAWKAVKTVLYRGKNGGALGSNVNILSPRKGGARMMAINTTQRGGRSGIRRRRKVSAKTRQIRGYVGADRWFVLHWVDAGAGMSDKRAAHTYRDANRGSISPRNFFTNTAHKEMGQMTERLKRRIAEIIGK